MSAVKRAVLAVVIVVGFLLVGGFIYFSINPPLALPETGYLSASTTANLHLNSFGDPRAYRLQVEPPSHIYNQSGSFPPARISASVVGEAGAGSTTIEVIPAAGTSVRLLASDQPGTATWELDCAAATTGVCAGDYVVVVRPNSRSAPPDARVEVFAEQEFPPHVPTPFMTGIGLHLDAVDLPTSRLFETDSERHTVAVDPDAPVALFDVDVDSPAGAVVAGGTLTVTAERVDPPIAVGPQAPPPVRVALVDGADRVVADVGARPGSPTRVAVPMVGGEYRLVAWWQDLADQRYEITWELQVGSVADAGRPRIDAEPRPAPSAVETITFPGEAVLDAADDRARADLGIEWETDTPSPDGLPATIGVLHTRVELTDSSGEARLLLLTGADYRSSGEVQVPVVLQPGEPVELVMDALLGCGGFRCGAWSGILTDPTDVESYERAAGGTLQWESTLVVWPLEPDE